MLPCNATTSFALHSLDTYIEIGLNLHSKKYFYQKYVKLQPINLTFDQECLYKCLMSKKILFFGFSNKGIQM